MDEALGRIERGALRGEARCCRRRKGFEFATSRLYAELSQFAVFHYDHQFFTGTGVAAHYIPAFFNLTFAVNAVEFDVGGGLRFHVETDDDGGSSLIGVGLGWRQQVCNRKCHESQRCELSEIFEEVHCA